LTACHPFPASPCRAPRRRNTGEGRELTAPRGAGEPCIAYGLTHLIYRLPSPPGQGDPGLLECSFSLRACPPDSLLAVGDRWLGTVLKLGVFQLFGVPYMGRAHV